MKDNQNRDLEAVKRWQEYHRQLHQQGAERSHLRYQELVAAFPLPDWTTVEGILVLRAGDSNHVAVPRNGAKTPAQGDRAASFDVLSLSPREYVCQLKKGEVRSWLWCKLQAEKGQ